MKPWFSFVEIKLLKINRLATCLFISFSSFLSASNLFKVKKSLLNSLFAGNRNSKLITGLLSTPAMWAIMVTFSFCLVDELRLLRSTFLARYSASIFICARYGSPFQVMEEPSLMLKYFCRKVWKLNLYSPSVISYLPLMLIGSLLPTVIFNDPFPRPLITSPVVSSSITSILQAGLAVKFMFIKKLDSFLPLYSSSILLPYCIKSM